MQLLKLLTLDDEGKDPATIIRTNQAKVVFPLRILQFFLAFLGVGIVFSMLSMFTVRHFEIPQNAVPVIQSTVQSGCGEKPTSLASWIRSPSTLMHNMSDAELFWRASFSPRIKNYPFERTRKIAFMFLTKQSLPLAPLWERFFKGHKGLYSIYIHSLPNTNKTGFSPSSVFYRRQIPSQVAEWGMMSMCDAERRLLANALLDTSNEWFVLLSEACIPLHNFTIVYRYISESRYSFMGSFDENGPQGRGRYNMGMAPEVNITEWRKGPQWFEINRKLAIDIVKDHKFYPKFEKFCRPGCYADEHYFPTMLSIQSPHLLANRSLTWVDWSRGGAHPATFGKADIREQFFKQKMQIPGKATFGKADIKEQFFKQNIQGKMCIYNDQIPSVCFLFARKFAPSALEPLLEIAPHVLGF